MKRSEMLELMCTTWINYCKTMGPDNAGVTNAMEHLLEKIEDKGMLPPIVSGYGPCDHVYGWDKE